MALVVLGLVVYLALSSVAFGFIQAACISAAWVDRALQDRGGTVSVRTAATRYPSAS